MAKQDSFDYAAKTAELENVLEQLQNPEVSLDEAMKLHEQGKVLVAALEDFLKHAENTVKKQLAKE